MKELFRRLLELSAPFKSVRDNLRREQKEMFFSHKNWQDQTEYFNFIKFLFSNPGRI
jgi:hypothetical protein